MKTAEEILSDNLNSYQEAELVLIPYLKYFVLDAMKEYARIVAKEALNAAASRMVIKEEYQGHNKNMVVHTKIKTP